MSWRALSFLMLGVAALLCASQPLAAHFVDRSWVYPTGSHVVAIAYDTDVFAAGVPVRFDFSLTDQSTGAVRAFDEVWVRVVNREGAPVLAAPLRARPDGRTALLYAFPAAGRYTVEARYRDASGADIATTSFPASVSFGPSGWDYWEYTAPALIWLIGFSYWLWRRRRRRSSKDVQIV